MPSSEVPDIRPRNSLSHAGGSAGSAAVSRAGLGDASRPPRARARGQRPGARSAGRAAAVIGTPPPLRDARRILVLAAHAELEVQVRPGGPAGGADRADALALLDALSALDVDAAQVRIQRLRSLPCAMHDVAVAVLPAGEVDDAVADRAHGGAGRRGVVDAVVLPPAVEDRVHAHREAGGHARELDRRAQERAPLALAVEAVVAALALPP